MPARASFDRQHTVPRRHDLSVLWRRLIEWLEIVLQALYLNTLWLLGCLPVVTAPASTAALFASARRWRVDGDPPGTAHFVQVVRRRMVASLLTGLVWLAAASLFAIDLLAIGQMGAQRRIVLVAWLAATAAVAMATVFVFVVLADDERESPANPFRVLACSARAAALRPVNTLAAVVVVAVSAYVTWLMPVALFGLGVLVALAVDYLAQPHAVPPDHAGSSPSRR